MNLSDLHNIMNLDIENGVLNCIRDELGVVVGYGLTAVGEVLLAIENGGNVAAAGTA